MRKYENRSAAFLASKKVDIVPPRFRDVDITKIKQADIVEFASNYEQTAKTYGRGFGLYIYGDSGVGKTHAAYGMFLKLHDEGIPVSFVKSYDISNAIDICSRPMPFPMSRFDEEEEGAEDMSSPHFQWVEADKFMDDLKNFNGILIIDDIGAEKINNEALEKYYEIIDSRYDINCPTIYTSNLSLPELGNVFYKRICSRINRTCKLVQLSAE